MFIVIRINSEEKERNLKKKLLVFLIITLGAVASSEPTTQEFMVREWWPASCGAPGGPCHGGIPPESI